MDNFNFIAELNDTAVTRSILDLLPLEAQVRRWGDELYFGIAALSCPAETLTREVSIGDIGFCPSGNLLCVFFGPTPASVLQKPMAENPVAVIGRTLASPDELRSVREGSTISVSVHDAAVPAAPQPAPVSVTTASVAPRDSFGERKLSQSEIDVLVQQLLAEKRKKSQ